MSARRVGLGALIVLASVAFGGAAQAADAEAESLYQAGRRAAQASDWSTACTKFRQSYEREAAPGTLLNLADCEDKSGALRSAYEHFEASALAFKPGDERIAFAHQRALDVERRTPKLTLQLSRQTAPGTVIEHDGKAIPASVLGTAMRVDPGSFAIVVRAPQRADVSTTLRLAPSETRVLVLTSGAPLGPPTVTVAPPPPAPRRSSALRTAGLVAIGAGGAAVGLGLVAGLVTWRASHTVNRECSDAGCNDTGLAAQSRGKTWSAVSTAATVVGGAGVVAGAGLLLFSAKRSAVTLQPTAAGGAVAWSGSF